MASPQQDNINSPSTSAPVAVVGMALRVPGAYSLEQFWDNIMKDSDCLDRPSRSQLERAGVSPEILSDSSYVMARPRVNGIEYFDADFFGISGSFAEQMNPTQRLFLECVWESLEHAGIVPDEAYGTTGVFAGVEANEYFTQDRLGRHGEAMTLKLGNTLDYFSLRVSHALNLVGPSFTSLATCATSLLAVHQAVQQLRLGECYTAIAGGAKTDLPDKSYYKAGVDGMISTTGFLRPFDAQSDGTIFGDGAAVVVLKLLDDAVRDGNPIHGVIIGSAFNNDGNPDDKQSFTAPTPSGQRRVIRTALADAAVNPETIGFVECHGTGTILGDPIEVTSLGEVFHDHTNATGYCALGSVKGHVGHLGSAAGAVGLIKTCLSLGKSIIPPVANFNRPNPKIQLDDSLCMAN